MVFMVHSDMGHDGALLCFECVGFPVLLSLGRLGVEGKAERPGASATALGGRLLEGLSRLLVEAVA